MRTATVSMIGFAFQLLSSLAAAATLVGTPVNPTGILGLVVDGVSYDVRFSTKSYNDLFTGAAPPPIFATNPTGAFDSEVPLSDFLNSNGVSGLDGVPCALRTAPCTVFVPISTYTSVFGQVTSNGAFAIWSGSGWISGAGDPGLEVNAPGGYSVCFPNGCNYYLVYAVFRPAATGKFKLAFLDNIRGGTAMAASAMNNAGQVVGTVTDGAGVQSAAIWNGTTPQVISPGESTALGINDSGEVVGANSFSWPLLWSATPNVSQVLWQRHGAATGINASGRIIGFADDLPGPPFSLPVQWPVPGPAPQSLPLPPKWLNGAVPLSINNSDEIVGYGYLSCCRAGPMHAIRWRSSSVTDLGTLWGPSSQANSINNLGRIAGWAETGQWAERGKHVQRAALWGPTTGAFDLGTLGGKNSRATGINIESDVVGSAQVASGEWHAVLWTHKHYVPVDLNNAIGPSLPQQITLTEAVATNDKCRIAVNGFEKRTGALMSFVLSLADQSNCDEGP